MPCWDEDEDVLGEMHTVSVLGELFAKVGDNSDICKLTQLAGLA